MREFQELTALVNERFSAYLEMLGGDAPPHRVVFSRRITTSWALIYYRRHLVRLSPYLFLLEPHELKHRTHWQELDATLRHEAAHAAQFARTGDVGHTPGFHVLLRRLGVEANGGCDLGPENAAFRYVYACPACHALWQRRVPLRGNWSCGVCAPGRYDEAHRMVMLLDMGSPWNRLRAMRHAAVAEAVAEARAASLRAAPVRRVAEAAVALAP
ncbi:MAG TPA: SprT-like domain-containing protein [Candidatus Thermoplasmatota archaeon]|nr:SprT-like domain-containing protein [Candidatus Thermoplasmatota archaeon]